VAAVRRGHPLPLGSKLPILLAKIAVAGPHREGWIFPRGVVDMPAGASLYNDYSARRRLGALARLRSSSLIFGEQASDPNRRALSFDGSPASGGWDRLGPGLFDR